MEGLPDAQLIGLAYELEFCQVFRSTHIATVMEVYRRSEPGLIVSVSPGLPRNAYMRQPGSSPGTRHYLSLRMENDDPLEIFLLLRRHYNQSLTPPGPDFPVALDIYAWINCPQGQPMPGPPDDQGLLFERSASGGRRIAEGAPSLLDKLLGRA